MNKFKACVVCSILIAALTFVTVNAYAALTPGETYTVVMSKVNSNGSVTDVGSTTALADADGKISFSFSSVPTSPDTFFLVITVKDSLNEVVRRSFVPAPPENGTGQLGANDLSTTQTDMILETLFSAGTDDPIVVAYGLILTRTPGLIDSDIQNIAILGKLAIMNGFETSLTENGVSASQLQTFKEKIVYNQPNKDLSNFTALLKSAVDNPDQASDDMGKAAGMIADIFIDAAIAADIDLSLIQAAHDAAGDVVGTNSEAIVAFAAISDGTSSVIDAAMSSFFIRIGAVKVKTSYTNALNILDASDDQITSFNTAVQTLVTTMEELDKDYSQYFMNPLTMTDEIKTAMNNAYQTAFQTFQGAIADSDANIAQMRTNIVTALNAAYGSSMTVDDLADVGTYRDMDEAEINWPIPQVVAVNKIASIILAGGNLVYDRDAVATDYPVPDNMDWLNMGSGTRTDYEEMGMPASFAALMGMQEDVMIAEHTKWSLWEGGEPTREQQETAKLAYHDNMELITEGLSGTTDGSTPISGEVLKALVKMMEHPELN
ncbi:MAG: hypothetical protein C4560_08775 [Nitrospiraceae bacterium]|nr:MAG: hypothetical protein C4560_08775 [Nitrospiraceae bacterium]